MIVVALTLFGEAAGETIAGKRAVASVIWKRAGGKAESMESVCKAAKQFSCWNGKPPKVPNDYPSRRAWRHCKEIAAEMVAGTFTPTIDATHFHAVGVPLKWARMKYVGLVGNHFFYKETAE
jgi:spore germination cell wall hydrolase CwlJ-like protein